MKPIVSLELKKLRSSLGYSTEYVSQQLNKLGFNISPNTLYNYENGVSQPKADMFLSLCKIYHVDNFDIFFDKETTKRINDYNLLNEFGKQKADEYIEDLAENPKYTQSNNTVKQGIISEVKRNTKDFTGEIAAYDVDDTPMDDWQPPISETTAD